MYKMTFKDLNNMTTSYELACDDLKLILNKTSFQSETNMYTTAFADYVDAVENDTLTPEPITFEMLVLNHNGHKEFRRFLDGSGLDILVEISKGDGKPRYAIMKRTFGKTDELNDTDFYTLKFTCTRYTHWIEIVNQPFTLNTEILPVSTYADSETFSDGYTYTDNFVYGGSNQTLESFRVSLPNNDGDKYAYLQVTIDTAEGSPAFGLNDNVVNTLEGYRAKDDFLLLPTQRLIINSYKPFKKLVVQSKITGDITNVQSLRYFSKRTYLQVPPGDNFIEFTNVTGGSVTMYKQYRLPY